MDGHGKLQFRLGLPDKYPGSAPGSARFRDVVLQFGLRLPPVPLRLRPVPPIQGYIIAASHQHISKRDPPTPFKASLEQSMVNAHHNPSPPIQGYIILASHPHISKLGASKPLGLPWSHQWSRRNTTRARLFKATLSLQRISTIQTVLVQNLKGFPGAIHDHCVSQPESAYSRLHHRCNTSTHLKAGCT